MKRKNDYIDIDEVILKFDTAQLFSCKPGDGFSNPRPGTVLDEDKSVRWNREEVIRLREAYDEEVKRLNREKNALCVEANNMVYEYIMQETGLSKEKAIYLWNFVYEKYHSGYDLFAYLYDYIELANKLKE